MNCSECKRYVGGGAFTHAPTCSIAVKACEKARRKWAKVLAVPCPARSCGSKGVAGAPCSFGEGSIRAGQERKKPHNERIAAATGFKFLQKGFIASDASDRRVERSQMGGCGD